MASTNVEAKRYDPYKNYKFRVKWDGRYVAGIKKVSALKRSTEVITYREGGDQSTEMKYPGQTKYEPITLERGITRDTDFEKWANKIWTLNEAPGGPEVSLADFRKDILIDVFNEAGQKVLSYKVFKCWVSEYQAVPELDASANEVAIQTIKLENEGWERDTEVPEPEPPSFPG